MLGILMCHTVLCVLSRKRRCDATVNSVPYLHFLLIEEQQVVVLTVYYYYCRCIAVRDT